MAAEEEIAVDTAWEEMKELAVEQQQCFYELLADCMMYKPDEHKYLKQNIGYAIFGPPKTDDKTGSTTEICNCQSKPENLNDANTDIVDTVKYGEEAEEVIDKIYNKICESTIGTDEPQPIYFGIIYIIIFRPKIQVEPKKKEETKKETEVKEDEKKLSTVTPIPIFRIGKSIQKTPDATKSATQKELQLCMRNTTKVYSNYEIWYIDTNGRVYKSWKDLTETINLPQCTMVLPMDGFYQPDPSFPITEDYSTVWLEDMESPACSWITRLCNGIDIASNAVGIGTIGLGIASLFTPLGPAVVATGLAATGVTGAWTIGRSSQQLADRISHEQSINLLDKDAFPHYLGIAGTAFGLGAMGGTMMISKAAASGMTIPNYAKIAFNTVQGGNIALNGVGVAYQGYCMVDKYWTEETYSYSEVLYFTTHLMFFAGSVVKIQFAGDIIESTQGKIIDDYRETLRNKRLRKKFNRVMRRAAENNTCKMSENAEVISYIRNRQQLLSANLPAGSQILNDTSHNVVWSFEHGKLIVNGVRLLNPIDFVIDLINSEIFSEADQNNPSNSQDHNDYQLYNHLARVLDDLLMKLYMSDDYPMSDELPNIPDFEPLLKEMSSMNIDEDSLKKLFEVIIKLIKRSKNKKDLLIIGLIFIWQYCKANLKKWGIRTRYRMQSVSGCKILQKIIIAIFESIDMMLDDLFTAFMMYMNTQGKVIDDYRETLCDKRKKFNRVMRQAAENNTCEMSENAEVISIRNSQQLLSANQPASSQTLNNTSRNVVWSFEHDKLIVNDVMLLDPTEFLVKSKIFFEADQNNPSSSQYCTDYQLYDHLARVLFDLLSKLYMSDDCPKSEKLPIVPDFKSLLKEMSSMNIDEVSLTKLFEIAIKLMKRSKNKDDLLINSLTFIWQYCQVNLIKEGGIRTRYNMQSVSDCKILQKIIIAVSEAIDMMLDDLHAAFTMYIKNKLRD